MAITFTYEKNPLSAIGVRFSGNLLTWYILKIITVSKLCNAVAICLTNVIMNFTNIKMKIYLSCISCVKVLLVMCTIIIKIVLYIV